MSDLEKCKDSLCPSKQSCSRYTLTDSVFMITANFNREDDALNCSNYINNYLINLITNNIMKQTAVDWLEEQYTKQITFLHREDFEQAKELEKEQQSYSEEDMQTAWNSSEQNMRFQFSSSAYKNVTFEQWLKVFKELQL